jgi:hypothetical protein
VLVLSRRRPPALFNARFIPADLMDEKACAGFADQLRGLTHVVYTALHERPELIAGWRHEAQISTNDRMLRDLFTTVERAAPDLEHVTLLQGTKAYGVHVRPIAIPAREDRDEVREEPNFYWLQEEFLKERQRYGNWRWALDDPAAADHLWRAVRKRDESDSCDWNLCGSAEVGWSTRCSIRAERRTLWKPSTPTF